MLIQWTFAACINVDVDEIFEVIAPSPFPPHSLFPPPTVPHSNYVPIYDDIMTPTSYSLIHTLGMRMGGSDSDWRESEKY
jgi:hypothetical protein